MSCVLLLLCDDECLIFVLDVFDCVQVLEWVDCFGDSVVFYKIGMELFVFGEYFQVFDELVCCDKCVFVDLKFFDILVIVVVVIKCLLQWLVSYVIIYGWYLVMMEVCVVVNSGDMCLLVVIVLILMGCFDFVWMGIDCELVDVVVECVLVVQVVGIDGVIVLGQEVGLICVVIGSGFFIVCLGICFGGLVGDDQKCIVGVVQVFVDGVDVIVVGCLICLVVDLQVVVWVIQQEIVLVLVVC